MSQERGASERGTVDVDRSGLPDEVPPPAETWPIVEHEPERIPVVPPDLAASKADRSGLVPAEFAVDLCAAVEGMDGMSDMWERIHDALDAIPGLFSEGGTSSLMDEEEVIDGSPLDAYLKGES